MPIICVIEIIVVPEGGKKSQREWSNSLKQARAPGTDIAELS
jgi:hypothetical protein